MAKIRFNGATSGANVLVAYGHDDLGRRTSLARGNGTGTSYSYDPVSRLSSIAHDLGGSATNQDLTLSFTYNPASQIVSNTRSNDAYAWTAHGNGTTSTTADGLNRIASWNAQLSYDPKGNLISDGTNGFGYSSENLLTQVSIPPWAPGTFGYDPLMRFATSGGQRFLRFQDEVIAEYYNGALIQRFIPDERTDETVGAFNSSGAHTWYYTDERGSTLTRAGASGVANALHSYDEYDRPTGNAPRIGFTGQLMVSFGQLYDFKNRFYHAGLGRFLQPDPIGYSGGMNMYAYVRGDPINATDPSGTIDCGLESNWRSGNCADRAVGHEVRKIGEGNGYSESEIRTAASQVLNYLYGRTGYAETALALLQVEAGVAARQGSGSACPGRFQCQDTPSGKMRTELIQLFRNSTFQASVGYIERQAKRTGNEWGFTGKGRADFGLVGGFIEGTKDWIAEKVIAQRAQMGADLFFHIHPNSGPRYNPGLSYGRTHMLFGGDLGIGYNYNMMVGAFALSNRKFYWFDGRGMKR